MEDCKNALTGMVTGDDCLKLYKGTSTGGRFSVTVIIIRNEIDDGSNPGQGWLHFTSC